MFSSVFGFIRVLQNQIGKIFVYCLFQFKKKINDYEYESKKIFNFVCLQ